MGGILHLLRDDSGVCISPAGSLEVMGMLKVDVGEGQIGVPDYISKKEMVSPTRQGQ